MKMYTTRGDSGETDLLGERVTKTDPRIDLLGTLDEATSCMGLGRAHATLTQVADVLLESQRDLYKIMSELAFTDETRPGKFVFPADRVSWLEAETDRFSDAVTLPREFVITGDTVAGAAIDVARAVVRRAERIAVGLNIESLPINPEIIRYLNRLSSLLFIAARSEDLRDNSAVRLAKTEPDT